MCTLAEFTHTPYDSEPDDNPHLQASESFARGATAAGDRIILKKFAADVIAYHGYHAEIETLLPQAEEATANFPYSMLGLGILKHRDWGQGAHSCALNLLRIIISTGQHLANKPSMKLSEAAVLAYAEVVNMPYEAARKNVLQAVVCCGFFSLLLYNEMTGSPSSMRTMST